MKIINNLLLTTTLLLLTTTSLHASAPQETCHPTHKGKAKTHAVSQHHHHDHKHEDLAKTVKKLEAQVQNLEQKATETNPVKVSLTPGLKLATDDGRYSFAINGYAQGDFGDYSKDIDKNDTIGQITRARLSASGVIEKDFAYKLEVNLDPAGSSKLKNATVSYIGLQNLNVTAGFFMPDFGLENSASGRNYTFIESSSASNIFPPNYDLGAQVSYGAENWSTTLGAFTKNSKAADGQVYSFRGTYTPLNSGGNIVHLGANAAHRAFSKNTSQFNLQEGPGSNIDYPRQANPTSYKYKPLDTGYIANVKGQQIYGAEFAVAHNQFSLQSEYMISKVKTDKSRYNFKTYYAQLAWTLTGESRAYDPSSGTFGSITPGQNFSVKNGGIGAWEVAARYNNANLNSKDLQGGKMHNYTLGLNWYLNNNVKLMADYTWSKVTTGVGMTTGTTTPVIATGTKYSPRILMMRAQVSF